MNLAITSSSFSKNEILMKKISELWKGSIKSNSEGKKFSQTELLEFLTNCDAAIVGLDDISDYLLEQLPKLKYISKYGVGLDNIDLESCKKRNIKIGWTGGVNKLSVAEMTIGFALSLSRNLYQSSLKLTHGNWEKSGGFQLSNKTVGIIGFGNIGKEVYRLLAPFNCNILVNDINPYVFNGYALKNTEFNDLISQCDIITVHTPLTEQTRSFISTDQFKLMEHNKPIIINTARGGIVDETEVIKALDKKQITGFAIDAYINEPTPPKELTQRDDVFCTPHIGGNSKEAVLAMGNSAIDNLMEIINE